MAVYQTDKVDNGIDITQDKEEDEEEKDGSLEVKIDLLQYKNILTTSTHKTYITKQVDPGDQVFMFHAKILDGNFRQ
jgi:catechol-2,3-dioxygenase